MVSSGAIANSASAITEVFSTYSDAITMLDNPSTWDGDSKSNAISEANNFVSKYETNISSQLNSLVAAVNSYNEWEENKNQYENCKRLYNEASDETVKANYYNKMVNYSRAMGNSKADIEKKLNEIKSKAISPSAEKLKISSGKYIKGLGEFTNYYQYNYNDSYGYGTTIKSSGCGPTSMAMVLSYLLGEEVTPPETASWSLNNGYRIKDNGTAWSFFDAIADEYGIDCEQSGVSKDKIIESLEAGEPVIMSMGPGHFTSGGHYIVLTGITEDGQITVADPNSETKSNETWDISVFLNEGKQMWSFSN